MKCPCGNDLPLDKTGDTTGLCTYCQWMDIIRFYGAPRKDMHNLQDQRIIDRQRMIDEHDCHLSPEDGCICQNL